MNAEDIKRQRKKLGYTPKKLAELLGVSYQTVNGYENGKEIPDTKIQLLEKILYPEVSNILNEPETIYSTDGYDKKLLHLNSKIKEYRNIISLTKNDISSVEQYNEIIRLLEIQVQLVKEAKRNHI
jgi:DNA-binding XRE family transcriptional regulator